MRRRHVLMRRHGQANAQLSCFVVASIVSILQFLFASLKHGNGHWPITRLQDFRTVFDCGTVRWQALWLDTRQPGGHAQGSRHWPARHSSPGPQ